MKKPPLLPDETLRRVLRVARFDGMVMLFIAGAFAMASAAQKNAHDMGIGLLVAGAGAVELHGGGLISRGEKRGMRWLIGSQLYLLAVILGYVAYSMNHVNLEMMKPLLTDAQRKMIADQGLTVDQFLRLYYLLGFWIIGVVSVFYQGGIALYYARRRAAVAAALQES